MPFYRASEMTESRVAAQPMGRFKSLAGELMKVGFVAYPSGKMSRPHYHPNEEQFLFILARISHRYYVSGLIWSRGRLFRWRSRFVGHDTTTRSG